MKFFHIHIWTKWRTYTKNRSENISPFGKFGEAQSNWYGYTKTIIEKWEIRRCKICGKTQDRKI